MSEATYRIVRFRFDAPREVIARGFTLAEVRAHCQRDDTHGDGWFDGYEAECWSDPGDPVGRLRESARLRAECPTCGWVDHSHDCPELGAVGL